MSPGRKSGPTQARAVILWWLGIVLAVVIWQQAARTQPQYVLPGPATTWHALTDMAHEGRLGGALLVTAQRASLGLAAACLIGMPIGWAMGTWAWLRELLASWVQVLLSVPPIIMVVVGMIWLGPTAKVVILVVALVTVPLIVSTLRDAVLHVDTDLLDMARVFSKGRAWTVRRIIIPSVAPPVLSAVTVAVGQSVRVTVMAELLSTASGLGAQVQRARTNLDTADVFALSVVMAALTLALEIGVLGPVRRRLVRPST